MVGCDVCNVDDLNSRLIARLDGEDRENLGSRGLDALGSIEDCLTIWNRDRRGWSKCDRDRLRRELDCSRIENAKRWIARGCRTVV